jgi:DNA-directed RNA polymerase specialized sigma24 family protein
MAANPDLFQGIARGPIRSLIHTITKDINAVDDIEQEVSIIWHRQSWRRPFLRKPLSYLLKIARNEAATHVKVQADRRRRFEEGIGRHEALNPSFLRQHSPDSILDIMTREKAVELFKASLPPKLKPVLDLHLEGRNAYEIADARKIRFTTAKSYLAAIAKRSQHFLEHHKTETNADSPPTQGKEP